MKSLILGTAGHVDHGKTALVRALTGIETDRWLEERQRGITIDLGFAPFPSDSEALQLSVVDVPGHEDFVKNMLAGASGVDVLLLVVAADEGPMPQTREHLWIARLLGVRQGVVAISKSDLVDREWGGVVAEAVREEIRRVFGDVDWPIITVSAVSSEGVPELAGALLETARRSASRHAADLFRLPVDRSFTVRGVGTVVTGTVWSGGVAVGDLARILPGAASARVRGIQVHERDVQTAEAGQRAALALAGVDRSDVGRGHVLVTDPVWRESRYLDVRIQLTSDSPWPLKHWQRVRLHLGTAETMARVVLFDGQPLPPGGQALAQLRLETPVVARSLDRFVLRFYSPVTTIGGGIVLDPWAARHSRLDADDARWFESLPENDPAALALALALHAVASRPDGASCAELALLTGASPADLGARLEQMAHARELRRLGDRYHPEPAFAAARQAVLSALELGHARDPQARGVNLEALRSAAASAERVDVVLDELQREGRIRIDGSVAALVAHVPALDPRQQQIADHACSAIRDGGLAPPSLKELGAALNLSPDALLPVLKFLAEQGRLVPVTPDLYYDPEAIDQAKQRLARRLAGGESATPSELRELLGVSRKYLIPLLEFLDGAGFTRRTPEGRRLRE